MYKKLSLTITTLSLLVIASCSSTPEKDTKNPFDPITLKENLIEGKTTQTQMLQAFGAPDMITEDSSKEDVWTYSQTKQESKGSNIGAGLFGFMPIPVASLIDLNGSLSKNETSSKSISLIVCFDKKKIVKNYRLNKMKY